MAVLATTLDKLRVLETIYRQGYQHDLIDRTLDKILDLERDQAQRELQELHAQLRRFEQRYHVSSFDFYQRFHQGELGDDADFFEWSAYYDMFRSVR